MVCFGDLWLLILKFEPGEDRRYQDGRTVDLAARNGKYRSKLQPTNTQAIKDSQLN